VLTVEILVNPKRLLYGHPAPAPSLGRPSLRVEVELGGPRQGYTAARLHLPRTIRGYLKVAVTAANTADLGSITVVGRSG
jgi:hypothetical protein